MECERKEEIIHITCGCPDPMGPVPDVRVINLTPHAITIVGVSAEPETEAPTIVIPASGWVARCNVSTEQVMTFSIAGLVIPVQHVVLGPVMGIPAPEVGTIYLVSRVAAEAARRVDVFFPDDLVRDDAGRVVGCRALGVVA